MIPALLVELGGKSAVIAVAALLLHRAMRGRAAGERVALLRAAVVALLALPLLALALPALELALLPAPDVGAVELGAALPVAGAVEAAVPDASAPLDLALALYALGAAAVLLHLGVGWLTLRRWTRRALPSADPRWNAAADRAATAMRRRVRLRVSPRVAAPLSWGVSPAWILIGPATERRGDQADAVISHEMAHVRRFDWPMLVATRIATALYWFNPLVWLTARALARETELAADEEAVRCVARADYAQALLSVAGAAHPAACGMTVAQGGLAGRIRGVLEGRARPASRLVCGALLVLALMATAPLAATRLVPAEAQTASQPAAPLVAPPAPQVRENAAIMAVAAAPRPPRAARTKIIRPRPAATRAARAAAPPAPSVAVTLAPRPPLVQPKAPAPAPAARKPLHAPESPDRAASAFDYARWGRQANFQRTAANATRKAMTEVRQAFRAKRYDAWSQINLAQRLRGQASNLEVAAKNPSLDPGVRDGHLAAARTLRANADQIEAKARTAIFGP